MLVVNSINTSKKQGIDGFPKSRTIVPSIYSESDKKKMKRQGTHFINNANKMSYKEIEKNSNSVLNIVSLTEEIKPMEKKESSNLYSTSK
jgi:hypothetical protein